MRRALLGCGVPILILWTLHLLRHEPSEPYYYGDETRHLMTAVFFHDALRDLPLDRPRGYAIDYYLQYPALGLLIWPPLFHGVAGLFMLAFGTSLTAALVLVGLFGTLGGVYFYLLVRRTHDDVTASLALLLLGLTPLCFTLSHRMMLEIPALALGLAACFHFQRYLEDERRRDLVLCCLFTALTALTRFNGIYLAPLFLLWLAGRQKLSLLRRPAVLVGMAVAVLVVAPLYILTALEIGGAQQKAAFGAAAARLSAERIAFYPRTLVEQTGWFLLAPALVGLAAACHPARRPASWPYLAMIAATYFTFTPLSEHDLRHSISWLPAFAVFAVEGCRLVTPRRWPVWVLTPLPVVGTAWLAWTGQSGEYVRGYEEAAKYVVGENGQTSRCFFDGYLPGNFVYQIRRHDLDRRLSVLRGDKLLYGMASVPDLAYEEFVRTPADVLALLHEYDPELIVVEKEQLVYELPVSLLLRRTLEQHPERFRLERTIALDSNREPYQGKHLQIYRNLQRNPRPKELKDVRMLLMGKSLQRGD